MRKMCLNIRAQYYAIQIIQNAKWDAIMYANYCNHKRFYALFLLVPRHVISN